MRMSKIDVLAHCSKGRRGLTNIERIWFSGGFRDIYSGVGDGEDGGG